MFWRLVVDFPSDQVVQQALLEGGYFKTMELHEEVKKSLKTEYPYLLVDVFQISGTRFILRRVEL